MFLRRCLLNPGTAYTTYPLQKYASTINNEELIAEDSKGTLDTDSTSCRIMREQDLDMICTICLENFSLETPASRQEKVALLVQCGHFYHQTCMNSWLISKREGHRSCPTCRTEVTYDFEVKIITVDILKKDWKSILRLRQKHAQRRNKLNHNAGELETSLGSLDGDDSCELNDMDWVHISLHPMEHTDPIAIQHGYRSVYSHNPEERSTSPFTIITPDEIPSVRHESRTFESRQPVHDSLNWWEYSMFFSEPSSPYTNWIPMR